MSIALTLGLCFFVNLIVGAVVWSCIDDAQQSLLRWYQDCPAQLAFLLQPLVLTLWVVGLCLWAVDYLRTPKEMKGDNRAG